MSIFERIQRIAKANINWLLDKAEPPEQELDSRIKELEAAVLEGRQCAAVYGATFRRMERERDELQRRREELREQAERALAADDEAAARKALDERVRLGERSAALAPGIEQGRKSYEQLRDNLLKLQDQLKSAKVKLAELRARQRAAEAHKAFDRQLDKTGAVASEGVAFERLEDEVLQAEAEADIAEEIRDGELGGLDLEQRGRDLQVEAEMREMKERLGK